MKQAVTTINNQQFFDGEKVVAVYLEVSGTGTIEFRPYHGYYPKSQSGWYVRDWFCDYRPVELMDSINKIQS